MNKERKKKKSANTLYSEGELCNPNFKYQSLRRQGIWEYKAYSRLMVLIRLVAFLSAFLMFFISVLMPVTWDKQRTERVIENTAAFLLSSVCLQRLGSNFSLGASVC